MMILIMMHAVMIMIKQQQPLQCKQAHTSKPSQPTLRININNDDDNDNDARSDDNDQTTATTAMQASTHKQQLTNKLACGRAPIAPGKSSTSISKARRSQSRTRHVHATIACTTTSIKLHERDKERARACRLPAQVHSGRSRPAAGGKRFKNDSICRR